MVFFRKKLRGNSAPPHLKIRKIRSALYEISSAKRYIFLLKLDLELLIIIHYNFANMRSLFENAK
jgi:hypothetical protein